MSSLSIPHVSYGNAKRDEIDLYAIKTSLSGLRLPKANETFFKSSWCDRMYSNPREFFHIVYLFSNTKGCGSARISPSRKQNFKHTKVFHPREKDEVEVTSFKAINIYIIFKATGCMILYLFAMGK